MAKRTHHYVTLNGALWKLTPREYTRLRGELARTGSVEDMNHYGPMVTTKVETIDQILDDLPRLEDTLEG